MVDTTGSMWDDIDAVQASARQIIEAIFDPARDLLDSRIALVEYNDPYTSVMMPFTQQPDPQDRKTAAVAAINNLYADGGDDFEELTFTGLLRALNGDAGTWRSEAVSRKIVLFGDATAKDAYLAPLVYALALGQGVSVHSGAAAFSLADTAQPDEPLPTQIGSLRLSSSQVSDGLALTTLSTAATDSAAPVTVQIFTVAIGGYFGTVDEFAQIASNTSGRAFLADGSGDLVDTLLTIINLPIYSISAFVDSVQEGDSGSTNVTFRIDRDQSASASVVAIGRAGTVSDDDVAGIPSTLSFSPGEAFKSFSVSVLGDHAVEPDEVLRLLINSVSEPATYGGSGAQLTILNDDAPPLHEVLGTPGRDKLVGTAGADLIRSLGGSFETLTGLDGSDRFVFGAETRNGLRERDTISDYQVGSDAIVLEGGTGVASIRSSTSGAVVFLDGDGDAIYVNGVGVNAENVTIIGVAAFDIYGG